MSLFLIVVTSEMRAKQVIIMTNSGSSSRSNSGIDWNDSEDYSDIFNKENPEVTRVAELREAYLEELEYLESLERNQEEISRFKQGAVIRLQDFVRKRNTFVQNQLNRLDHKEVRRRIVDTSTQIMMSARSALVEEDDRASFIVGAGLAEGLLDFAISFTPGVSPKAFNDLTIVKRKTPSAGGGLRKRWKDKKGNIYEWDSQHAAVEKYNKNGIHLGEFDPNTGAQTKPANPDRSVEK